MIFIEALIFFILGFIFSQWIIELIESVVRLICTKIEVIVGKDSLSIATINNELQQQQQADIQCDTRAIGFTIEDGEEEYEEEDI